MPRSKTDFSTVRNSQSKKSKSKKSFGAASKQSDVEMTEGQYQTLVRSIEEKVKCFEVTGLILSLDGKTNFGFAKAFLPLSYIDGDIMDQFLETFDNPTLFEEVIGKKALVDIEFNETEYGTFPNIVSFAKLAE